MSPHSSRGRDLYSKGLFGVNTCGGVVQTNQVCFLFSESETVLFGWAEINAGLLSSGRVQISRIEAPV
jgi:hypothetical protein